MRIPKEPAWVASKPSTAPEGGELVAPNDPGAELLAGAVKRTPWWALSLAFHGVAIAAFPLVIVGQRLAAETGSVSVGLGLRPRAVSFSVDDGDLRRSVAGSPGVVETGPATDDPTSPQDPRFALSNRDTTENGEDFDQAKGPSRPDESSFEGTDLGLVGRSRTGPGTNVVAGVGGNTGGAGLKRGGPYGDRLNHGKGLGGTWQRCCSAREPGLSWLVRHQSKDGGWSTNGFHAVCHGTCTGEGYPEFDTGASGLAVLALLGAGYTPQNRALSVDSVTKQAVSFGRSVRNGVRWLVEHQDEDGCVGPRTGEWMYNHAIATLALTEAYGLTNAVAYRAPAQRAIRFLEASRNDDLAWRYTARPGRNDTSVTGWCVMALKSAQISGLEVSRSAFDGARAWLDRVTEASGQVGYDRLASGEIYVPGQNEKWAHHPSMTAVGVLCRIFIDRKKDANLEKGGKILMQDLPTWEPNAARPTIDFYYWYYATLALFQLEGPTGANWIKWNKRIADVLCGSQRTRKDGCLDGSWDTKGVDRWGHAGGRVYGTAINILTLEASYRYESVFGGAGRSAAPPPAPAKK